MLGNINLSVGLVNAGGIDNAQQEQLAGFLQKRGITVVPYAGLKEAQQAFYERSIAAILSIPVANSEQPGSAADIKLYLPQSETASSLILMLLQEPLKHYENFLREQRGIILRYTDLQGKPSTTFEFIYSVILPVLMFFPAFVAGGMVVDSLSEEVENNTLETLLSAPLSINRIAIGKIAAALILAAMQSGAWILLLQLNRITVDNPWLVLMLSTITAGITTVGAAFIAVIFRDRERSQFVYSLFLLVAASLSYLLNLSPITQISRLAINDYYTNAADVMVFAVMLAALMLLFIRSGRFISRAQAA
jgi:ABC-type transport system involved in multi-copper enzyme maturation permease subunit